MAIGGSVAAVYPGYGVMHDFGYYARHKHCHKHSLQVYKGGVSYNTGVGVEYAETYEVEYHVHADGAGGGAPVLEYGGDTRKEK